jgi:hypothetical protein
MDCKRASEADRVCDCREGVQWPNDKNPIFFMGMRFCEVRRFAPVWRLRESAWQYHEKETGAKGR